MNTDIFIEVWEPYTLVYKELWFPLDVVVRDNPFYNYASSEPLHLRGFSDVEHTVNMYINMRQPDEY